jgi:hypothetical protein
MNIDGAREDLLEAFEGLSQGPTTLQRFGRDMLNIATHIEDIINTINDNKS